MSRIEANEEYMLYLNLCKWSKKTSVKHRVVKTNHNAQTCANYQSENIIFNMSNHPQTWRIGKLSAPSVCVYIYMYMYNTECHKIQRPTQLSSSVGSSSMIRRRESHHQAMGLVRTRLISLPARIHDDTRWYTWYYDLALLWKLKAKTAKMHSVCNVSLPGTPLSCMLKVNGFSLNPQTPQTLFHLIRKVETCCSNVKVLKFPGFAITANCSSRGQITFTLPIGIQFQSFLKLSKAYVQRTFGHKTNIKTNSARKDRKEAPGSCLRGASFECQSRMTQYTWTEQSQEFALYINIVTIINIYI